MTTLTLRQRLGVALAALALLVPAGIAIPATIAPEQTVASAEAAWGSHVQVSRGSGVITVRHMNGNFYSAGAGGYIKDVSAVHVPRQTNMYIGGYVYSGGLWGKWVTISQQKVYSVSNNVA